jgi:hypothetical protein
MKPLHYGLIGAACVLSLLISGFFVGRATKHCKEYLEQDYESAALGWKAAADSWKSISEKEQAERADLQQYIDSLNGVLRKPVQRKANDTFRALNGMSDDSIADILLTAPRQF